MSSLFIETEAKVFCLLIVLLLWFFQTKNPQALWGKIRYMYLFVIAGAMASILKDIAGAISGDLVLQNLCDIAYGACCALAAYFGGKYACGIKIMPRQGLWIVCALVFGGAGYLSLQYGMCVILYAFTFAIIAAFVFSQYDKIRTDNLTKLYNRYGLDEEIRQQLQQYAHDKNDSFYLVACDLDNFKHINDTWGHMEGDRALILISAALLKVGKKFKSEVFRIGGDEFVVIMDTSDESLATALMDAIKCELDAIDFRDDFDIKMSMGYVFYDGVTPIEALLNNADKKLYQAKRISKNV